MDVSGAFSAVPGIVDPNGYSFKDGYFYPDTKGNHNANLQKELYNNYSDIVSIVSDVFETASEIVFNTYHKWIEFKSANPEKYKKILGMIQDYEFKHSNSLWLTGRQSLDDVKHSEEIHETWNFDLFYRLMRNYTGHRLDIPDLFDRSYYLNTVNDLRRRLLDSERNVNNKYLSFDIENSYEFMDRYTATFCHDTFAIKVRPDLKTDDRFNNLSVRYNVYLDIYSVIDSIIYNIYAFYQEPDNNKVVIVSNNPSAEIKEEDLLDKDNFKAKVLYYFKDYFEKMAKHICLEVLDTSITIRNGWNFFLKKFDRMYTDVLKCENFTRLNNYLNSFKRYKGGNVIDLDTEKYANTMTSFIRTCMTKEISGLPIMDNDRFIESLLASRQWGSFGDIDVKTTINNIVCTMFFRAFSIYFETISSIKLFENIHSSIKSQYSREFDRDYDFESLNSAVAAVDDYVCKDFFKNIIAGYTKCKLVDYDTTKFKNGEKTSFMFAKFKRKLWMAYTAEIYALFDLKLKFEEACKKHHSTLDDGTDNENKFKRMFNEDYNHILERVINNFAHNSGSCGYMNNMIPYENRSTFRSEFSLIDNHINAHISNIADNQAKIKYNIYTGAMSWIDDMIKLISEWNGQKNDGRRTVISYNQPENAGFIENDFYTPEDIIKSEFKKMLIEIGLLDFEVNGYY